MLCMHVNLQNKKVSCGLFTTVWRVFNSEKSRMVGVSIKREKVIDFYAKKLQSEVWYSAIHTKSWIKRGIEYDWWPIYCLYTIHCINYKLVVYFEYYFNTKWTINVNKAVVYYNSIGSFSLFNCHLQAATSNAN